MKNFRLACLAAALSAATCLSAIDGARADGSITSHRFDAAPAAEAAGIDPAEEIVDGMPEVDPAVFDAAAAFAATSRSDDIAGAIGGPGAAGTDDLPTPEAVGSAKAPYSTARVAVSKAGKSKSAPQIPVTGAPYRSTGRLQSKIGAKKVVCTASLIKKGVLVTAAHCVAKFGKGEKGFASWASFTPSQYGKKAADQPYGTFKAINVFVPTPYLDGSDTCQVAGKACNNDIALIVLAKKKVKVDNKKVKRFAGQILGTYAYGFNGYGFKPSKFLGTASVAHLTQLGYATAFDSGLQMQRNDTIGWYVQTGDYKATQFGSPLRAGSDGGPLIVNFGTPPKVKAKQAFLGKLATPNVVVGVAGYLSKSKSQNLVGASYFGRNKEFPGKNYSGHGGGNIGALLEAACTVHAKYC